MKPKLLLRLSVACVLFFAVGHSMGHFTRKESKDLGAKGALQNDGKI
jgi:hypothetical protein